MAYFSLPIAKKQIGEVLKKGGRFMFSHRRLLALVMACALLLAAVPAAKASSTGGLYGTFSGSNAYYSMTITLNGDGTYFSTILQGGQTYGYSGCWSSDASYMYFWPNDGIQSSLSYWLIGDTLTLTDWNTGDTMTMTRLGTTPPFKPDKPVIPEGLIGTWSGRDGDGLLFMTLDADGKITVAYDRPDAAEQTGTYTVSGNIFQAELPDGTKLSLQFLLTRDTLVFAGEEEGETITLTRYYRALSTALPTPVLPPKTMASPEPTPVPVIVPFPATPIITVSPELTEAMPTAIPPEPAASPTVQGLAGIWQGTDGKGSKKLTLTPDGRIEITYEQDAASKRMGTYTADGSTMKAIFDNGTAEDFRYILMGDTLLITDAQLGSPVTFVRQLMPQLSDASDPALIGTWGGTQDGEYGEMTLDGNGKLDLFIPSDPSRCAAYTYKASNGKINFLVDGGAVEGAYTVKGDVLTVTFPDGPVAYVKKPAPLARLPMPAQSASPAADVAIVGAWGGLDGGTYVEITLYGDGVYVKFVPEDETLSVKGTYMSGSGNIAVLLPNGALQGTYSLAGEELTISFKGARPLKLLKQSGPLVRLAQMGE
jgi:hypothetical protein